MLCEDLEDKPLQNVMIIYVTRYEKTRLSAGIINLRYGFLKCSQWYLIKTEILSVLYYFLFLIPNLAMRLFVWQHVIDAR